VTLRRVREWPIRGLLGSFAGLPAVDTLKLRLLKVCHNAPTAGHLGQEKTLELLSRNYYWLRMRAFVNDYVRTCDACAHNKTSRHAPYGPLQPLPVPPGPWKSVSMDFIVELPPSDGLDAIYVCMDRFTKMAHFIPPKRPSQRKEQPGCSISTFRSTTACRQTLSQIEARSLSPSSLASCWIALESKGIAPPRFILSQMVKWRGLTRR